MDPVDHFNFPDGSRYSVPADFEKYLADLLRMFPEEREGIERFFAEVKTLNLVGLMSYFQGKEIDRFKKHETRSLSAALDENFTDEKLKLLLTADCPHWGSPPSRISYIFDSMLRLSYFLGNYYPKGGSQRFSDDLGYAFKRNGGTAVLRASVEKILVEGDKVAGVDLELGPVKKRRRCKVKSPVVISNADMVQTAKRLVGEQYFDRDSISWLEHTRKSFPCYLMHIGLRDTELEELDEIQGYHWDSWDTEQLGTSALRFKVFVPTMYDQQVAPDGSQALIIQKVTDINFGEVEDWPSHKGQIDKFVTGHLERMIPRFKERAVVQMSASAMTSHRFTLNSEGAMLGWEMAPDQLGRQRPGVEGPLEGLYFCGHWTRPGGGITPVLVSAMQAASAVTGENYF